MKMAKRDYFLMCLAAGCYRYKQWTLEVFTVTLPPENAERPYPYGIARDGDTVTFINDEGVTVEIVGGHKNGPLFSLYDELLLSPGDIGNVREAVVSTYGQAFINQLCLVHPLGDAIAYQNGEISPGKLESMIEKRLVDDNDPSPPPGAITITQLKSFNEACIMTTEYAAIAVPAATVKTMTVDPAILKRRKELMEQYKDRLDDPVVQTMIGDELIRMDREWMKGDPGDGFYFKSKSFDVVRKKLFLTVGEETGFGVKGQYLGTALNEGWDIANMPNIVNGLRDGSYSRGAMTAKGGEATKFNYRIFQNSRITEDDCGSTRGVPTVITKSTSSAYLSNSIIVGKGLVLLDESNIGQYLDKTVIVRSPAYCLTGGTSFCATCMGKRMADTPEAIASYAADIGSTFMLTEMKKMHGSAMSVAVYDVLKQLR